MGSFRQTLRDLPFIGYFLRVLYSVWKLPEMWDVLTGAVPVARPSREPFHSGEERIKFAGGVASTANSGQTPSVMDLTARVIDLTALVREQAMAWAQHQERLYSSVPVYVGAERVLVRTEAGQLLMCDSQDVQLTPWLIDRRVWHPALTAFYRQNIQAGMKYLEIGADIGYFTVVASALAGTTGQIHAFEPDAAKFSLLKINCGLNNGGHSCELFPLAVSEANGPGTSLDEHYRDREIVFDFVRIDAQGAEPLVIAGAEDFLRRCTHTSTLFAIKFKPRAIQSFGHDPAQFLDHLLQTGFSVWQLSEKGELRHLTRPEVLNWQCNAELILSRDIESVRKRSPSTV
jgi:hypothetical protein